MGYEKTERPGASGLQKAAKGYWIQTQNVRTLGGKWNLNATVVTLEQNINPGSKRATFCFKFWFKFHRKILIAGAKV